MKGAKLMNQRAYVCSDLHGEFSLFKEIVKYIHLSNDEHLYLLGDYCDYGVETSQLLDYLHELTI